MFKGAIFSTVNRFGQETTTHLRPITREDRKILRMKGTFSGTNAIEEVVSDYSGKTHIAQLNVHPSILR